MPGPTVKEILLKWGIDNSNWKSAIKELSSMLDASNKQADKAAEKAAAALDKQKAKLKEYIADRKSETAEIEKQIDKLKLKATAANAEKATAQSKLAVERQLTAEVTKQVATQKQLQAVQKTLQTEINTKLMQEKLVTAEINRQTAALRQQALQQRIAAGGTPGRRPPRPGSPGGGGGGIGGFLAGMLGGGMFGNITAAVASAEALGNAVKRLTEYVSDLAKEAGPLQQVKEQFEKLAPARGINDPVEFMNDMRKATRGLVDDMQLYKNANTFLQSSVHATSDQVIGLTQATVGLARAQGRDASTALNALTRFFLTGRAQTLAYATGIQRVNLMVGGMGRSSDAAITSQKQLNQAIAAVTAQYKAVGEPAETYSEALKRLSVSAHNVIMEFVLGATSSGGFQNLIKVIDQLADKIQSLAEAASKAGEFVGNIFAPAGLEAAQALWETIVDLVTDLWYNLKEAAKTVKEFVEIFSGPMSSDTESRLTTLTGIVTTLGETFVLAAGGARELLNVMMLVGKVGTKPFWEWNKALDEFLAKEKQIAADTGQHLDNFERIRTGKVGQQQDYNIKFAAPAQIYTEEQQEAAARKIAKVREEIAIEESKTELDLAKMRIADETELLEIQYKQGLVAFQDYLAKKKALNEEDHQATLKSLKEEYDAKQQYNTVNFRETRAMAELQKAQAKTDLLMRQKDIQDQYDAQSKKLLDDTKSGAIAPAEASKQQAKLDTQRQFYLDSVRATYAAANKMADAEIAEGDAQKLLAQKKYLLDVAQENNKAAGSTRKLTQEEVDQEVAARKALVDLEARIKQDGLQREKEMLENSLKEGIVSSEQYFQQRVDLINQEFQISQDAAQKNLDQTKNSLTGQANFAKEVADAESKRQKELTQLWDNEWNIRVQTTEKAADRISSVLDSQLRFQQELSKLDPLGNRDAQLSTLEQLIKLEKTRLDIQKAQLKMMEEQGLKGSETWAKEAAEVSATAGKVLQLNQELRATQDYTSALAGAARTVGIAAGFFDRPGHSGGTHTQQGLNQFAEVLETLNSLQKQWQDQRLARQTGKAAPKPITTPAEAFAALAEEGKKTGDILEKAATESGQAMKGWSETAKQEQDALSKSLEDLTNQLTSSAKEAAAALTALAASANNAAGGKAPANVKHFQGGGSVGFTGLGYLHQGEFVFQSAEQLMSAITKIASVVSMAAASLVGGTGGGRAVPTFASGVTSATPTGVMTDSDLTALTAASVSSSASTDASNNGVPALGSAAATAAKQVAQLGNEASKTAGTGGKAGGIGDFMDSLKQNFKDLFSGDMGKMGQGASGIASQASSIAGGVGGLINAASGQGGPFKAGMQGLSSGMSLGANFGPWGALIGGGAGLITGIFSGKAEKQAEQLAQKIVAMFNAVQTEIQNGTQTLSQGILQQISTIETAVSQLSGKKGGRQQLENILPQMEQQLQQLQQQQQQTIKQMDQNLDVINTPIPYQSTLQQVQQIIDTYQQYIQAGGNVANANEFLRQSFVNLVQNGMNELNQDEQSAIQNALNYNDLLLQRQNLISNTNQQIQNIMSQGVAVRQMPEGVSKAQQIEQVEQGAQVQLDQMNQQIAVSGYQLQVQQQIFGLATTRIGLETQLVGLQNSQTNLQTQQILALQRTVSAYQNQIPENMQSALGQLGLGASYVAPTTEPGLMPTPPVKTGIPTIDLANQQAYQQALQYYQQQANMPTGYLSTTGALPGTSVVPGAVGTAAPSTTLPPGSVWLTPGSQTPAQLAQAGALSAAQAAGAGVASQNAGFYSGMPGQPGTSPLTTNGELIDTVSTGQGQALLVTMATPTGPGTSQLTGNIPAGIGAGINPSANTFNTWAAGNPSLNPVAVSGTGAVSTVTRRGTLPPMSLSGGADATVSGMKVAAEQQISQLSSQRVSSETQLVNLKMQEISADMQRVQAHQQLLEQYKTAANNGTTMEGLLQATYETRGRQGFGKFYGETSNPT